MPKFRKLPVEIEAIQFTGGNAEEIWGAYGREQIFAAVPADAQFLFIETLEGQMTARVGDWIIRGVQGELYPCRDDIFRQTYEPAILAASGE